MSKKQLKKIESSRKDYKKIMLIIVLFILLGGIILSTFLNSRKIKNKNSNNGVETIELREFIEIDVDEAINKINNKETFVLYIGYSGCQACEKYNPILKRVQTQKDFITYYLDYKSINKNSNAWKKLIKAVDVKQSLTVSIDEKNEKIDDKVGNIMKKYGYTPVTIYFINGDCANAYIGSMSSSEISDFLGF